MLGLNPIVKPLDGSLDCGYYIPVFSSYSEKLFPLCFLYRCRWDDDDDVVVYFLFICLVVFISSSEMVQSILSSCAKSCGRIFVPSDGCVEVLLSRVLVLSLLVLATVIAVDSASSDMVLVLVNVIID